MSFDVKYSDVQNVQNDYMMYRQAIQDAAQVLDGDVGAFVGLASFQGQTADSAKAYFSDVHRRLLRMLDTLVAQLETEYATGYYEEFAQAPVSESSADARWVSSAMDDARQKLDALRDGDLSVAEQELQRAAGSLPAGLSFPIPSASYVRESLNEESNAVKRVRDGVQTIEGDAVHLFSNESGDFEALANALHSAMARCTSGAVSMVGYEPGMFQAAVASTGLTKAYEACAQYQDENREALIAAQKDSIAKEQFRIEEEARKAAEEKKKWAVIGTVFAVAIAIGGGIATVATLGAGAPVLVTALNVTAGVIGTASATKDVVNRVDQINRMDDGDWGADKSKKNKAVDAGIGAAKTTLKYGAKDIDGDTKIKEGKTQFWEGVAEKNEKKVSEGWETKERGEKAKLGAKNVVRDYVIDKFIDTTIDATFDEYENDELETGVKVTKAAGKGTYDAVKKVVGNGGTMNASTAGGVIGTVGKCGTLVADYHVEKYNDTIEECAARSEELDKLKVGRSSDW